MTINNSVKTLWQKHWKEKSTIEESGSFYGKLLHQKRLIILKNLLKKFNQTSSVLDMGCGGGTTITAFKTSGFNNIIGIDFTEESMQRCEKLGLKQGKDVFLLDAENTHFPDNHFDIVFSEGLWEHFTDPRPHMAEAIRLTKTYIIVIQPDHFSFFGRLMYIGWNIFSKNKGGVKEYSFPLSYFKQFLKMYNFELIISKSTILHEQTVMVFKKQTPWQTSQQHELEYTKKKETSIWQIPYSLKYWKNFLHLNSVEGQGIEIGCGNNGIYNFTSNVIGLDSINFHKPNFIQATAEYLPFSKANFIILCNSLDHCQNPSKVLKESSRLTSNLILWIYTYPKIVSFILSQFDPIHPYHFTKSQLNKLLNTYIKVYQSLFSPLNFWHYTKSKKMKLKLFVMYLLNIKGICIHLTGEEFKWI